MKHPRQSHLGSNWFTRILQVGVLMATLPAPVSAIIFHTGDPAFNTTAPTGVLETSGWQLQGRWGNYLGTPIAPNLFITAKHVGGAIGSSISFQGVNYTTIDSYAAPTSDLRIFRICGTFPEFAQLYDKRDELGKSLVVFGRGTQRGSEVMGDSLFGPELKGWKWGSTDRVMRWGENVVSTNVNNATGIGELLAAAFDANAGENEGHLSSGDSGGAVFIKDNATWKLAGINYAVDGPFNTSTNGGGFQGALFDQGGLYTKPDGDAWEYINDRPANQPSSFYVTRISGNIEWIEGIIDRFGNQPPPVLQSTTSLGEPFTNHSSYIVDEMENTITINAPTEPLFLRISDCDGFNIVSTEISDGKWILRYEPQ